MELHPLRLERVPCDAPAACAHCGASLDEGGGYVYYVEGKNFWVHRRCVHQFLRTPKANDIILLQAPITIVDEGTR